MHTVKHLAGNKAKLLAKFHYRLEQILPFLNLIQNGTALIKLPIFGGKGNDGLNSSATTYNYGDESRSDVAIDNAGNIYITSTTTSGSLPGTTGTAQPIYGGGESDGLLQNLIPIYRLKLGYLFWW